MQGDGTTWGGFTDQECEAMLVAFNIANNPGVLWSNDAHARISSELETELRAELAARRLAEGCRRPLLRAIGDAAHCHYCGAQRDQPCQL